LHLDEEEEDKRLQEGAISTQTNKEERENARLSKFQEIPDAREST